MPKQFYLDENGQAGQGGITPEIQKMIDDAKAEAIALKDKEWQSKINETEKGIRLKLQKEAEKEAEKNKMSAEEKAKAEYEEKFNTTAAERDNYKTKYRDMYVRAKLNEAGLPADLYIDNKRLDVEEEKLDEVIKDLKKKHETLIGGKTTPSTTPRTKAPDSNIAELTPEQQAELAKSDPAKYRAWRKQQKYGNQ
jgi:hypothetical protein